MSDRPTQDSAGLKGVPFGRYLLLRKIATGGMAQLYLATMTGEANFEKLCVVKKILPHLSEQTHFVDMFLDEARIAARLNHPNIVQIYDLGRVGHAYFIAMEYIAGEDLAKIFSTAKTAQQMLPIELCARIAANICAGLHFAHEQHDENGLPLNIVHRDVSPQNVLVTYEGQIKLVDFGIAKAANKVAHTRTGTIMGKAAYMSPEQCHGQELDRRSDVFAVGALLHEILCLRRLFKRENELLTMRAITEEDAPLISECRPGVPPVLEEIVSRALHRDRDSRYQSCREMREALERFIAEFGVPATSLELSQLLEDCFPDHVERQGRIREAGSLSEVLRALPEIGLSDLGTPSAHPSVTITATQPHPRSSRWFAGVAAGAVLIAGLLGWQLWQTQRAPQRGRLLLTSTPAGAQVQLDGQTRGRTPLTLDDLLLQHAYQLVVTASGFHPHLENVFLTVDHASVQEHLVLEELPASRVSQLRVETTPPGASIWLNNVDTGKRTPFTLRRVQADLEHQLRVQLKGYVVESRRVLVRRGNLQTVTLTLEKKVAHVARPRPHGATPRRPNDSPARPTLPRPAGKGLLSLKTKPWTRVYHGQIELGETPLFKVELPAGSVNLRLVNPDKGIDEKMRVEIKADQLVTLQRTF